MIIVTTRYKADPGMRDAYIDAVMLGGFIEASRNEEGNIQYEYLLTAEDPDGIVVYEIWRDQQALELHKSLPHFLKLVEMKKNYVSGETTSQIYEIK